MGNMMMMMMVMTTCAQHQALAMQSLLNEACCWKKHWAPECCQHVHHVLRIQ
jgi:hypothetical protein